MKMILFKCSLITVSALMLWFTVAKDEPEEVVVAPKKIEETLPIPERFLND
jgi:hypothetical protein